MSLHPILPLLKVPTYKLTVPVPPYNCTHPQTGKQVVIYSRKDDGNGPTATFELCVFRIDGNKQYAVDELGNHFVIETIDPAQPTALEANIPLGIGSGTTGAQPPLPPP